MESVWFFAYRFILFAKEIWVDIVKLSDIVLKQ